MGNTTLELPSPFGVSCSQLCAVVLPLLQATALAGRGPENALGHATVRLP